MQGIESGGSDYDDFGQPQYSDPYEIAVRWQNVITKFTDAEGQEKVSKAKVFVESDVQVDGVLMLGLLTDITDATYPKKNTGALEIQRFDKLPTFDADQWLRTAYL